MHIIGLGRRQAPPEDTTAQFPILISKSDFKIGLITMLSPASSGNINAHTIIIIIIIIVIIVIIVIGNINAPPPPALRRPWPWLGDIMFLTYICINNPPTQGDCPCCL